MNAKPHRKKVEHRSAGGNADLCVRERQEVASLNALLERKTTLVRMMIHDMKGPLSSVMANLDLLARGRRNSQEKECVETALIGCQDLLFMIQNLLEIGKMEQGKIELNLSIVGIEEFFGEVVKKMATVAAQKGIRLRSECRSAVRSVSVDAHLLERMVSNLVLNALAYSPEGAEICLFSEDGAGKGKLWLAVSDQGVGIPAEFQETIFDPYRQVTGGPSPGRGALKNPGSVGLGLAFCRLAAEQHGGRIWVQSVPGSGSTFFVELPTDLTPFGSGLM